MANTVTIYHYANMGALGNIKQQGLLAFSPIHIGDPSADKAVFGLLEPVPQQWEKNTQHPGAWRRLIGYFSQSSPSLYKERKSGNLLLAITVNPETDPVEVIDWGPAEEHQGYLERLRTRRDSEMNELQAVHQKIEAGHTARNAREATRMPLSEWLALSEQERMQKHSLPEVIWIGKPESPGIPPDRIHVANEQPLLIRTLELSRRSERKTAIVDVQIAMKNHPEVGRSAALQEWFAGYHQAEQARRINEGTQGVYANRSQWR